jgi:hypothetical protein
VSSAIGGEVAEARLPEGIETGFVIRQEFARGRLPISQLSRMDGRYVEVVGFDKEALVQQRDLGYYGLGDDLPPHKMDYLAVEILARAAGFPVISPRDGDAVHQWDYRDGGAKGRLIVLCKDGLLLSEERGRGDTLPRLTADPSECLRTATLHTTSKHREEMAALGQASSPSQPNLFPKAGLRKLSNPSVPQSFQEFT